MRAGKALDSRKAEVRVQFKDVPGDIFKCEYFPNAVFLRSNHPLIVTKERLVLFSSMNH